MPVSTGKLHGESSLWELFEQEKDGYLMNLWMIMTSPSICVERVLDSVRILYSGLSSIFPMLTVWGLRGCDW